MDSPAPESPSEPPNVGYAELNKLGLIQTHLQKVASAKLPAGATRTIWHRALRDEFSTETRKHFQAQSKAPTTSGKANRSIEKDI